MSKRRQSDHNKVVTGVLALALAFTSVVSTAQLASINDDLAASVSGRYVAVDPSSCVAPQVYDAATQSCITPSGGGGGGGGGTPPGGGGTTTTQPTTITCANLSNQQVSPDTCNAADASKNACLATNPPGTWNGSGSGSCTAAAAGTGTGTGTGTCSGGTPILCSNGTCAATQASCTTTTTNTNTTTTNTTTTNNTNTGTTVDTVGSCQGRGGTWDAATSHCSVAPTTNTTTNTNTTNTNTTNTTGTCAAGKITCSNGTCANTQLECSSTVGCSAGQVKDSTGQCVTSTTTDTHTNTNTLNGTLTNTTTTTTATKDPAYYGRMGDSAGCTAAGYKWDSARRDCFPGGNATLLNNLLNSESSAVTCGEGQFFDFREQKCKTRVDQNTLFNQDALNTLQTSECPEWDTYCQEHKDQGFDNFEWQQEDNCLSASETKKVSGQLGSQLKSLQKDLSSTSLSTATDSYTIASTKTQLDSVSALDLSDPCQAGQAKKFFEDFDQDSFMSAQQVAQYKRELDRIQSEIDYERNRITDETAQGYLDDAEDGVTELRANPPVNEAEPWKLFESLVPACMRAMSGGMGGSSKKPAFGPMCSIEELVADGAPRGLLDAARMTDNQGKRDNFGGDMCQNAAKHIAMAESMGSKLSGKAKTTFESLIARGKALAVKCQSTAEEARFSLMQQFEALGKEVEKFMTDNKIDSGESSLNLGGLDQMISSDLMDLINQYISDKIGEATNVMLAKLTAMGIDSRAIEEVTLAMGQFKESVTEGLGHTLEVVAGLSGEYAPEGSAETASEITQTTGELVQTLAVISEAAPESENDVEDFVQEFTDIGPLPLEILDEIEGFVEDAQVIAENGGDPSEEIASAQEVLDNLAPEELTQARIESGIWFAADVDMGEYWGGEADVYVNRAYTELGLTGTINEDGQSEFNAGGELNVCEGLTMMAKTMGFEGEATPSAEIEALVGSADWAAPYLQEIADEVGISEVRDVSSEAGGCGGAMDRAAFAHIASELADSAGVEVSADLSLIDHYTDFEQMTSEEQADFATAYEIGMITGANGGTTANFNGNATRLEAAKMLTVFQTALQNQTTTSSADVNSTFADMLSSVSSGDPGSGITE